MYLQPDIKIPMMYISDCIKSTLEFIEVPENKLSRRIYNIQGFSSKVEDFVKEVQKNFPELKVDYKIDENRCKIAEAWPVELDDTLAKKDWDWNPEIKNLQEFVERMVIDIKKLL